METKKLKDCDYLEATERFIAYITWEKDAPLSFCSQLLKIVEKWKQEYKK